jgi:hypothetical protein
VQRGDLARRGDVGLAADDLDGLAEDPRVRHPGVASAFRAQEAEDCFDDRLLVERPDLRADDDEHEGPEKERVVGAVVRDPAQVDED